MDFSIVVVGGSCHRAAFVVVVHVSQVEHALGVTTGEGQTPGPRPGGQHQTVLAEPASVPPHELARVPVEPYSRQGKA